MTLKCTMILGDCLEILPTLQKEMFRFVFADLPYGMTAAVDWDIRVPIAQLWRRFNCLLEKSSPVVLSASGRFMHSLIASNEKNFRYDLVFHKESFGGFLNANKMPLRTHENLLVFYRSLPLYNPQKVKTSKPRKNNETPGSGSALYGSMGPVKDGRHVWTETGLRHPGSVLYVPREWGKRQHPTQKPVALLDWIVRTYSNPGDSVLDPVSGSGTTAVSAISNGRHVACIEKDRDYFEASVERVRKHAKDNAIDVKIEVHR